MFNMFGRTGAPQKWGPHMREALSVYVILTIFRQLLGALHPTGAPPLDTAGGLLSPRLPGSSLAKIPAGARGGPHIFLNRARV